MTTRRHPYAQFVAPLLAQLASSFGCEPPWLTVDEQEEQAMGQAETQKVIDDLSGQVQALAAREPPPVPSEEAEREKAIAMAVEDLASPADVKRAIDAAAAARMAQPLAPAQVAGPTLAPTRIDAQTLLQLQLVMSRAEHAAALVEMAKLQIQVRYGLTERDTFNLGTGEIQRAAAAK